MVDDVKRPVEWPTLGVVAAIYGSFAALTFWHAALPWWLLALAGGYVTAWHGSLQHEAVHGHPTASPGLNELLVFPSLWLWLPFRLYRQSHRRHHETRIITDPLDDPESYYLTVEQWRRIGPWRRTFLRVHNTLAGRLLLGPLVVCARLLKEEGRRINRRDYSHAHAWLLHALSCAVVLGWVSSICGMSLLEYIAWFVYPGISLTLLRSFAEHQASFEHDERTVVVNCGPLMSLLYLNNNLHALHHAEPEVAWYRLPARSRTRPAARYVFPSYAEIVRRYLLTPKEPVGYPL